MNRINGGTIAICILSLWAALTASSVAAQSPPRKNIATIAKAANGAVVSIIVGDKDRPIALGTGFLINKNGAIMTNYHVIQNGDRAVAEFPDGRTVEIDGVLASNKARDVAIIKAHGDNFQTLTLGDSDRLEVGDEVVAIGSPHGLESTVSNGIVSAIRVVEEKGKLLQITAPISHGSSGGPLFNMAGEVVGITTLYLEGGENLNFAIPINDAKRLILKQSAMLQNFPNEVIPKEIPKVPPKETHDTDNKKKATFSQQKSCLEQAEKMFNDSPFSRAGSGSNKYVSNFDVESNECYVEVTSFVFKGENHFEWHVLIYDAFAKSLYGEFLSSAESHNLKMLLCGVRPRGQPEITCASEVEFYGLVLKHFGIAQD